LPLRHNFTLTETRLAVNGLGHVLNANVAFCRPENIVDEVGRSILAGLPCSADETEISFGI
jgi:hypothetical protein